MGTIDEISAGRDPSVAPATAHRLQGRMGVFQLAFTVLAYNAPVVGFLGFVPAAILLGNGIGTPIAFLFGCAVVAVFSVGMLTMAKLVPTPGGFYAFISAGLGKVVGLGSGFAAMTAYLVTNASGYALGGIAMNRIVEEYTGADIAWWVWGLGIFVLAASLGYFHIDLSAKALSVLLAAELVLVFYYIGSVILKRGWGAFDPAPFTLEHALSGSIGIAILFAVGTFGGFEATIIFREEVRDPARTIPRATYLVVGLLGIMYALLSWVFINSYGTQAIMEAIAPDPTGAVTASITEYSGSAATEIAQLLLLTSSFALVLSTHNIAARYGFNLAVDGVLPSWLSQVHKRHSSPHRASIAISLISLTAVAVLAVAQLDPNLLYAKLAGAYSYSLMLLFVAAAAAIATYLLKQRDENGRRRYLVHAISTMVVGLVFTFALYLATVRFDILSGATGVTAVILVAAVWSVVAAGMCAALYFRANKPHTYAKIGRQDVIDHTD